MLVLNRWASPLTGLAVRYNNHRAANFDIYWQASQTWLTALLFSALLVAAPVRAADCVIFLHGLARTAASMDKIAGAFAGAGYATANVDYPSREHPVEVLAPLAVGEGLDRCLPEAGRVHFITHSLGGILVRYYLDHGSIPNLGRVVMLAPPNGGSEVVDRLRDVPGFAAFNGPAGVQLGTGPDGIPARLGPVAFELGVIAGTSTFNPILSQFLPNPDDGKVSLARARVTGMRDFLAVERSHPFIMRAPEVIRQALAFVAHGRFERALAAEGAPGVAH